ncbi:ATP-binding cassette domain-containing protein [bacterium D16-76]|nr:ATP-binding cassette domain-containing protein [bacterium D16-76]
MSIMEIKGVRYSYDNKRNVLKGVSAELDAGKMYTILGPSGCGKTTLLSLLGGLDSPSDGQVLFQGEDIEKKGLAYHRKNNVAFIFQSYNLIDYMTPAENVALTSKLPPLPILERLGLTREEAKRNVLKLSGGQQQRVAIARALASDASVILADEPTGNLDEDTAVEITNILKECAHQMNKCVIIVTHSNELAKQADVILKLRKGELQITDIPDTDMRKGWKR